MLFRSGGGLRSGRLHAPGRPRHRPRAEDQGLQIAGGRTRHRRGKLETWLRHGPARIRTRRANPRGPRPENHPAADEQPEKSCRAERLRFENRPASAHQSETQSAQ